MAEKEEKKVPTLEELQKQVGEITKQVSTLTEENKSLKEQLTQKDLEIAKLSVGSIQSQKVTKEVEDEDVNFDFDF